MSTYKPANSNHIIELISLFENAYSKKEQVYFKEDEFVEIIQYFLRNNEAQKALYASELALERYPYSSELCLTQADSFKELGDLEEAKNILLNNFKIDKTDPNYYLILSDIYLLQNETGKSISICDEGLKTVEYNEEILHQQLAEIYLKNNAQEKLIFHLVKSVQSDYINYNLVMDTVDFLEKNEELVKLENLLKEIIDINPFDKEIWMQIGQLHKKVGKYNESIEAFEFVEALDADHFELINDLAYHYLDMGLYKKCINIYLSSPEKSHNIATKHYILGLSYYFLNDDEKSKKHFREAIQSAQSNSDVFYYWLAVIHYENDNYKTALALIEASITQAPNNINYLTLKGDILSELDETEECIKIYRRVIESSNEQLDLETLCKYALLLADWESYETSYNFLENLIHVTQNQEINFALALLHFSYFKDILGYESMVKGLQANFEKHDIVFEFMPELKDNKDVQSLIDLYTI